MLRAEGVRRAPSAAWVVFAALLVTLGAGPVALPFHVEGISTHPALGALPSSLLQWRAAIHSLNLRQGPASHPAVRPAAQGPLGRWGNLSAMVGAGPSGRVAQMAWDASDGYVVLYGGLVGVSSYATDTWTFSDGVWTNITRTTAGTPPALVLASMAFDPSTQKVVLFGGQAPTTSYTNYTWAYHDRTWTNVSRTSGPSPPARSQGAMATDSTDGEIVLTGGLTPKGFGADTWTYKNGQWTNATSIAGLGAKLDLPSVSDDPAIHGVLMTGEIVWSGPTAHFGTYEYSGGTWHNFTSLLPNEPPGLPVGASGYLPSAQAVVGFSGLVFNATGSGVSGFDTWEFQGGAWRNITDEVGTPPASPLDTEGAVIPGDDALLVFGGEGSHPMYSPFTYALSAPPSVTATSSSGVLDEGMAVGLSGSISNGLSPDVGHWNFGDGSPNGTGLSTSHTYARPGLYTATLNVTSAAGQSGFGSVSVFVNPPLSAAANTSADPTAGALTSFSIDVTGGTPPYAYAWSFGDGTTSTAADPSHAYLRSGTVSASVKVTDAVGPNVTVPINVTIGEAPSAPAVPLGSGVGLALLLSVVLLIVIVLALVGMLMRRPKSPFGGGSMAPGPSLPWTPASPPPSNPPPPSDRSSPPPGAT